MIALARTLFINNILMIFTIFYNLLVMSCDLKVSAYFDSHTTKTLWRYHSTPTEATGMHISLIHRVIIWTSEYSEVHIIHRLTTYSKQHRDVTNSRSGNRIVPNK
jgi:hypothetical protein